MSEYHGFPPDAEFPSRLTYAMVSAGYTFVSLSIAATKHARRKGESTSVSEKAIREWAHGRTPQLNKLRPVAEVLRVRIPWLLWDKSPMEELPLAAEERDSPNGYSRAAARDADTALQDHRR